jgi:hypothetical protein
MNKFKQIIKSKCKMIEMWRKVEGGRKISCGQIQNRGNKKKTITIRR